MKQSLLLLATLLTLFGCSKEIKEVSKSCTYNGQPVDCSVLEGNGSGSGNGQTTPTVTKTPLRVEGQLLYAFLEESGREFINILAELKPRATNNAGMVCELNIPREKIEIEIYEGSKLVIKGSEGEQIFKYKLGSSRSDSSKLNGIWISEERNSIQRNVLTLTFNNRHATARLDCIPL